MAQYLITYEYLPEEYLLARKVLDDSGLRQKIAGSASRGVDLIFNSYLEAVLNAGRLRLWSRCELSWHNVKHWENQI